MFILPLKVSPGVFSVLGSVPVAPFLTCLLKKNLLDAWHAGFSCLQQAFRSRYRIYPSFSLKEAKQREPSHPGTRNTRGAVSRELHFRAHLVFGSIFRVCVLNLPRLVTRKRQASTSKQGRGTKRYYPVAKQGQRSTNKRTREACTRLRGLLALPTSW